jgi:hypothetical protein
MAFSPFLVRRLKVTQDSGSLTLAPQKSLEANVLLPRRGAPEPEAYILSAGLSGYERYRTQTQFFIEQDPQPTKSTH